MKTDIKKHENGGAKSWIKAHLSDIIPVLGLILVLVFFNAVSGGKVFTKTNFNTLFNEAFSLLIVTYALIFVMAQGKNDMSLGGVVALAAALAAHASSISGNLVLPVALLVGLLCGLLNGLIVTELRIDSFIATIAMSFILKGFVELLLQSGVQSIPIKMMMLDKNSDTGAALIIVNEATGQNEIVVIIGACGEFKPEEVQALKETVASAGTVLCQLETNPEATYKVLDMAKQAGVTTVLNPAPARKLSDEVLNGIDYITPNETEAEIITGIAVTGYESASKAADVLLGKGVKNVVITLGNKGYYAKNAQSEFTGAPIQVNVVDTTGAGDAFNGGFTAALAAGMSFEAALIYGNVTGGLAVEKLGTAPAMPYKEEIMAALNK